MAHLWSFRQGWQAENFAKYILSQFCFISHPETIADDVGSDLFCILFERIKTEKNWFLIPKNSFAIQIKSNPGDVVDLSKHIGFLCSLEVPFFIGAVVDKSLVIYSGEYIPDVLSHRGGMIATLRANLSEKVEMNRFYVADGNNFLVRFPLVARLDIDSDEQEIDREREKIEDACKLILNNITSRQNMEFIFRHSEGWSVFAGEGSARHFQNNFYLRLAEAFANLGWLAQREMNERLINEFTLYQKFYRELSQFYTELPAVLTGNYEATLNIFKPRLENEKQ